MKGKLSLHLLLQGVLLYETLAWYVRMPKEIHGLKGSCLVIPCSFHYTSNPPTNPHRVVWYQWDKIYYPKVYDSVYSYEVIGKFRGKTGLYGDPSNWECSLLVKDLDLSHNGEKIYAWIDPDNVGRGTYRFFDFTSTIFVDTKPKQPIIDIYGGDRTGDTITVTCHTFHTCPYSKPKITLKGVEGSDKTDDVHIENGLWKITLTRTAVVKAEQSDIECTVTHDGGITTRATKNKKSACVHYNITIEPNRADVTEGVAKDFTCTVYHSCQKDLPTLTWNYEKMQVTKGNKRLTGFDSATFSAITFLGTRKDNGKKLICTAKFSGRDITTSVDLHVKQIETRPVDPGINKTHDLYEADVVPRLTALPHSCVVIPCSFKMSEEEALHLRIRWMTDKGYMFHTNPRDIVDNFKGRTKLFEEPVERNCTVEIDNVQMHDNGPFCFQADKEEKKYMFTNNCVLILMRAPEKPVMSSLPDNIEAGTSVTVKCSVNHTCPSHPPSITWSVPAAREMVQHQSIGGGLWETVSIVTFIPTGYEEEDQIVCTARFWGDKTVVNGSTELTVKRIQGVGLGTLAPSIIVPILVILLLCVGVIIHKRRSRMPKGGVVWNNIGHASEIWFYNNTCEKRDLLYL